MADYRCKNRSNYFRVLDEEKYQKIVSRMSSSDGYFETGKKERDGQLHHNFVCEGQIMYVPEGWEEDCDEDEAIGQFYEDIQQILPDDEAVIITKIGHEKLCYLTGFATVITKNQVEHLDIWDLAEEKAGQILGRPFRADTCY